ncbi:MAG: copper resistance protein [Candidatus Aminicenantes bacterium]|nr:copper resistance protein [Candidatus Aminicenantes bacterium]
MPRQSQGRWSISGQVAVCLFGLFLLAGPVPGKELELIKKVGDLMVVAVIERNPPTVAKNAIEVRVTDAAGNPVQDAKLLVNYYMPPMARMPPMNYKVEAKWKKDAYKAVMDLIMAGPWIILVRITIDDKTVTAKFNIDAR